jgi:TP901 family phage tail tape measure protein
MALADTAQLAVRINLEGNASAGLDKLTRKVNGLGGSVGRAGRGIGQIGAGIAKAGLFVGGAAVAGLTGAAKAAIDFEDAFAGVKKTVNETELLAAGLTFDELATSFREMATEIPIAATEFARLGETAGALGVDVESIEKFVETTALLGVTTDLTADQAADALGRIGTILDFTTEDYVAFADSLVALGNAGASTESEIVEISKRFAAEADAAGLAQTEIAGLASATASLGFAPERGGTALSRVFANMGTNISLANAKGKEFARVTGRSITNLQDSLDKGEGLGIFLDVLKGIKGMSPTDANRTLKALGINNTSDRTIFRAMAENLPFVNEQLEIAANATGSLSEEAQKRFDTIASKITLLKNNIIEAGIAIGTAMLPAIGRATEALSEALKDPATKADLAALGGEIGAAIDDIDWKAVIRSPGSSSPRWPWSSTSSEQSTSCRPRSRRRLRASWSSTRRQVVSSARVSATSLEPWPDRSPRRWPPPFHCSVGRSSSRSSSRTWAPDSPAVRVSPAALPLVPLVSVSARSSSARLEQRSSVVPSQPQWLRPSSTPSCPTGGTTPTTSTATAAPVSIAEAIGALSRSASSRSPLAQSSPARTRMTSSFRGLISTGSRT